MRREDHQPKKARNETLFDVSCRKVRLCVPTLSTEKHKPAPIFRSGANEKIIAYFRRRAITRDVSPTRPTKDKVAGSGTGTGS